MKTFYLLLISALLSACNAGSGEGLDDNGQPIGQGPQQPVQPTPPDSPDTLQANFTSIQDAVLTPICAQCHFGNNAPLGLRMDSLEASEENLINVDSATNPTFKRVLPGDADNSFFYLKIIGASIAGNQMPLGQAPLDQQTQETIKTWIDSGAPRSAQQLTAAAKTLNATTNALDVSIQFSQQIQMNQIQPQSMRVVNALTNQDIYPDTQITWLNDSTMILQLTANNITQYRPTLILNQPSISTIVSENGSIFDGDRDGIEGGEFRHEISTSTNF